jgi:hypothetical protein
MAQVYKLLSGKDKITSQPVQSYSGRPHETSGGPAELTAEKCKNRCKKILLFPKSGDKMEQDPECY